jgi:hypothetical protein
VFEGTPDVVPTAQDMSEVGKRLKSAVEQGETLVDIGVLWYERAIGRCWLSIDGIYSQLLCAEMSGCDVVKWSRKVSQSCDDLTKCPRICALACTAPLIVSAMPLFARLWL